MRAIVDEFNFGKYKYLLEFDSGGDPDFPFILWIYESDKPLYYQNSDIQVRKYFSKKFSKHHLRNFCLKFANNDEYRNQMVTRGI